MYIGSTKSQPRDYLEIGASDVATKLKELVRDELKSGFPNIQSGNKMKHQDQQADGGIFDRVTHCIFMYTK